MPVQLVGDAVREAVVVTETTTIEVEAEATHIPEFIEVDIEGAAIGTQILAGDLVLPQGTSLLTDREALIVNITAQSAEETSGEAEAGETVASAAAPVADSTDGGDEE